MRAAPLLPALLLALGCSGADPGLGLELPVRVRGAQLIRGPLPEPAGGPAVTFVDLRATRVLPGEGARPLAGRVGGSARALRLGAAGAAAHWLFPTELLDPAVPDELDWSALLDFARTLEPGPLTLQLQAADGAGAVGAVLEVPLEVVSPVPDGALVITLEWDADADVDLYVKQPDGVVLGPKNVNAYQRPAPPNPPDPPEKWRRFGFIDLDSNGNCVLDGRRRESAIWRETPPAGSYQVRVDLAAPCGQPRAAFRVTARLNGELLATSEGVLYPVDAYARGAEADGARGLLALELAVP